MAWAVIDYKCPSPDELDAPRATVSPEESSGPWLRPGGASENRNGPLMLGELSPNRGKPAPDMTAGVPSFMIIKE